MSATSTHRATVAASTKKNPAASGGIIGAATAAIASLKIEPFSYVTDPMVRERLGTRAGVELLQTFAYNLTQTIERGHILVVSGTEYPIKGLGRWTDGPADDTVYHIIVEDIQT